MSRGINWFKDFKIEEEPIDYGLGKDIIYSVEFLDGDSTSFSEGNITKYQEAFKKYGNVTIPYIEYEYNSRPDYIKDRIEWFKELSDKGYYFSFQNW